MASISGDKFRKGLKSAVGSTLVNALFKAMVFVNSAAFNPKFSKQ
jgi:hypothetical protein